MSDRLAHQTPQVETSRQRLQGHVRELAPTQLFHFQWHLLRLEDGCRRLRFGTPTSDACLREYGTRVDGRNTTVLGYFVGGHMRGAVELRSLHGEWAPTAEIAFSVEMLWQGQGIGSALMTAVVETARERRLERLFLTCHVLNRRMQRIAEGAAARLSFDGCECLAEIAVAAERAPLTLAS
jgi:GNAT superfamily N-acetyltransferase